VLNRTLDGQKLFSLFNNGRIHWAMVFE